MFWMMYAEMIGSGDETGAEIRGKLSKGSYLAVEPAEHHTPRGPSRGCKPGANFIQYVCCDIKVSSNLWNLLIRKHECVSRRHSHVLKNNAEQQMKKKLT